MPKGTSKAVHDHLRTLFHGGAAGELGDDRLLSRFLDGRDGVAESAFAALVERHGPMVLGVCRRVLGDAHEAEDAFQATFLVLARKAATVVNRENLDRWLYGVALRTALESRARATRRRAGESRLGAMPPAETPDPAEAGELRAVLDEELSRLPERYRAAVLLCELEGLPRREAARRLGVSEGTLSSRLARAKGRLRDRLARRGVAPSVAALSAILAREARAVVVPPKLVETTTRAAALVASGSPTAAAASAAVATLTEGVLKAMFIAKLRGAALGLAALALVATGVTATSGQDAPGQGDRGLESRLDSVERKLDRLLGAMEGLSPGAKPSPDVKTTQTAPDPKPEYPNLKAVFDYNRSTLRSADVKPPVTEPPSESKPGSSESEPKPGKPDDLAAAKARYDDALFTYLREKQPAPDFAKRLDVLETRFDALEHQVREMGQRLDRLDPASNPEFNTARPGARR